MAFSSIDWDGYGVVTYCDGTTDTAGGSWAEEGGGTFSYNTDTYLTGAGSIGSQYANKNGYTYYTATTSFDFTSGGTGSGTQKVANQYFYVWVNLGSDSSVEPLADEGLSFIAGSSDNNNRHWLLAGSDDSNGWGSGWKLFIIDPTTAGTTDDGTYDSGNIDTWGLWIDTQVSVRAETIFVDQISVAGGVRAHSGTGTLENIIDYCYGTLATRVIGSYTYQGRFNYALGPTIIGDSTNATANTILTATSQINGYNISEYYNGSNWVPSYPAGSNKIILEKHASYTTEYNGNNTSMFGSDNSASGLGDYLNFTKDSGADFDFNGGTFEKLAALTHDVDWSVQNCVLSECKSRTITGGTFDNNAITASDPLILSTSISNCSIKSPVNIGVNTSTINNLTNCFFEKGTGTYGVEISGTISTDASMSWNCTESGFTAGTTGSDVGITPASSETIWVSVNSGITLTININTGASTPSVANAGTGTVEVLAGAKTLTLTNIPENTQVTLVNSSTRAELQNSTAPASGIVTYTHTGGETIDILLMSLTIDPNLSDIFDLTLPSADSSIKFQTISDLNYYNPA